MIPYVLRIVLSLLLILVVNRYSKNLFLSIFLGALLLAVWSGHSLVTIGNISWDRLSSYDNLLLMLVVGEVIILSSQLKRTGHMSELVQSIQSRFSQRTSMALLPAVIGLLPMPGGAIFSAPLVQDCDKENRVKSIKKVLLNYWFRHIWEYWWPLYPGALLALDISGIPLSHFILIQFPLTLFSILGGYVLLLRKLEKVKVQGRGNRVSRGGPLLLLLLPIGIVILVYTLIKLLFPQVEEISRYIPMAVGVFFASLVMQLWKPLPLKDWKKIIFSKRMVLFLLIVIMVRVYGAFVEAKLPSGTFLMDIVKEELSSLGIPQVVLTITIPFICGITTGIAIGFVGASFPIVLRLLGENPPQDLVYSTVVLAFGFGYVGMILSPVHICLIVSNEHFKTPLLKSIGKTLPLALFVMAGSMCMYLLLRWIL